MLLNRRDWFRVNSAGVAGLFGAGWLKAFAADAADNPQRRRACILLWMNGGPTQLDTFDLKPGHANGGPFKAIDTAAPGVKISEHLPKLAQQAKDLAIVRSMSTKEGDHGRAAYLLRTGSLPMGAIEFPSIGSLFSKELGTTDAELPNYISIAPQRFLSQAAYGPGFLGPQYAPLVVGENVGFGPAVNIDQALKVQDLTPAGLSKEEAGGRVDLLRDLESEFLASRPGTVTESHRAAYEKAVRLMRAAANKGFDLSEEPAKVRDAYGRNIFGQGCLLARRLVERGVPFVEVTLSNIQNAPAGWDTHTNNFEQVKALSGVLDAGWSTLMSELRERGLLETTTIVWMGEFGRTPKINPQNGRDHYPNAWTVVLGGGGIKGGQVVGKTSDDGMTVTDRPVSVPDLLATVAKATGIDIEKQNMSNVGRPIRIVDRTAKPITEVLS